MQVCDEMPGGFDSPDGRIDEVVRQVGATTRGAIS
jgi:hypothetical protein